MINHSCEPNAGIRGQILLVAMRNIRKGEEITFDYAMADSAVQLGKMQCCCPSKRCRNVIDKIGR